MHVVGRLHRMGVSNRIRIAPPYPAPCTTSSMPYVPPETMKKVAATNGQRVSLADFLGGEEEVATSLAEPASGGGLVTANFDGSLRSYECISLRKLRNGNYVSREYGH